MRKHVIISVPITMVLWYMYAHYMRATHVSLIMDIMAMGMCISTACALTITMAREITLYYRTKG